MSLHIHLLGPIQISRDGQPIKIPGHKPLALLTYVLVTGQAHSRQHLIDLLFDGPDDPKAALRWTLSKLRAAIGSDYIVADRQEIGFNVERDYWLDVTAFESGQTELYRGDFLEGMAVREAPVFEEWLFFERERLRDRYQTALTHQLEAAENGGDDRTVIDIGHQLLRLDNLRDEWHRAVMAAYARSGQREAALAQFERYRQILADELGVEPAEETVALFEQIRSGTLETPRPISVRLPAEGPPKLPAFLEETEETAGHRPLFVARERELAELDEHLKAAIDGHGRVLFVTGEAGRGKTALLGEFATRSQEGQADLIVAGGNCNAYSGLGDPYLPFREIMGLLSGDVESRWAAGTISRDHARRLWNLLPDTVQALVDHGSNLVNLFISGPALVKRGELSASGKASWLEPLQRLVARGQAAPAGLEQHQFFEQYTQVLRALADRRPLLLLLDDLQWADSASTSLLFHLGRRLAGSRILIVGAYRPSEVVLDRSATSPETRQHPLEPVLNEFKRLFGEIELDLGRTLPAEGRVFVEALLDSQPNQLSETFRVTMFQHTKGHPLFTIELLRDMQERGDLIKNQAGRWVEGSTLDWNALPARVEAVIEQRLGRLDEELQDILTTASVEGERFTAQVVARVQGMDERQLLKRLSRELARRHRLVTEDAEVTVDSYILSRYQFRHVLFQQYLYDRLSPGERRLLHGEMAALLEELYQSHTDEIAVQLARHYLEAGQGEKAIPHLLHAGDQARLAYAHEAAIQYYRQAVIFLKEQGDVERTAATLMKLGLTYHNAFEFEQSRLAYEEAFALRQETRAVDLAALSPVSPTLKIALPEGLAVLDPALITDVATAGILEQLFSGLIRLSPEMETMPEVAQSWQVLEGGRRYIFHLRDDVVWSDGLPVSAGDFEYAWKRVLQPVIDSPVASYLYVIKGATAFHQGQTADPNTVAVQAVDALTLLVELEEPTSYFLYMLGHYATCPVPRHIVAQFGPSWVTTDRIVTNGPFRVEAYQPDGSMTLVRSPSYPGPRTGNVGRVEISFIKEHTARLKMYETDSLEMLDLAPFSPAEMEAIRRRYARDYRSPPILDTFYVEFDLSRPPFADPRVRQAFVMAIDRQRWAIEVEQGFVSPALGGFVPPGMPGHSPQIGLPYDPEQARRLLAEAGFPGGRGFPAVDLLGVAVAQGEMQCQHLQTQWRENLSVEVVWKTLEFTTLLDRLNRELPNLHIMCWIADYPDPDNYLRVAALQYKKSWRNETYSQLVERARRTTDQQVRLKLYEQADKLLVEEAVIMPLYYNRSHLLVKPWVSTYPTSALGYWFWKDVVIDPAQQPVQPFARPSMPHTFRVLWPDDPPTLDPALTIDYSPIVGHLFSGLVATTPELDVVPDVAQRWEILNGGRKYVFYLRDDIRWSDGTSVTAHDFEYAWKRILAPRPATGSLAASLLYDIKEARAFHRGEAEPEAVGVRVLDAVTLVIELEGPVGYFLNLLTYCITYPVPRHTVETYGEDWTAIDKIVTNGPFRVESWQRGERLVLTRNEMYHGRFRGNVEKVECLLLGGDIWSMADWDTRSLALYETGDLDVMRIAEAVGPARQKYAQEHISFPMFWTIYVSFDLSRPPFDDLRVRRAFALAIDSARYQNEVTKGLFTPATGGFLPPAMPGYSAGIGLPYDPAQARRLLAEAGYPDGHHFPKVKALGGTRQEAEYVQAQWRENLGVEVEWDVLDIVTAHEMASRKVPALFFVAWGANYPDPDSFLRVCFQQPYHNWRYEAYNRLVEEARQLTDQEQRLNLYRQADRILMEQIPLVPLFYGRLHFLVKPWVRNFRLAPTWEAFWKDVIIDPHQVISVV